MAFKAFVLLFFINLSVSKKTLTEVKHTKIPANPTIDSKCLQIVAKNLAECPAIEAPVCVKMKYKTRGNFSQPIYMSLINRCELNYVKCYQDMKAEEVSMKYCDHHYEKNKSQRKVTVKRRSKRSVSDARNTNANLTSNLRKNETRYLWRSPVTNNNVSANETEIVSTIALDYFYASNNDRKHGLTQRHGKNIPGSSENEILSSISQETDGESSPAEGFAPVALKHEYKKKSKKKPKKKSKKKYLSGYPNVQVELYPLQPHKETGASGTEQKSSDEEAPVEGSNGESRDEENGDEESPDADVSEPEQQSTDEEAPEEGSDAESPDEEDGDEESPDAGSDEWRAKKKFLSGYPNVQKSSDEEAPEEGESTDEEDGDEESPDADVSEPEQQSSDEEAPEEGSDAESPDEEDGDEESPDAGSDEWRAKKKFLSGYPNVQKCSDEEAPEECTGGESTDEEDGDEESPDADISEPEQKSSDEEAPVEGSDAESPDEEDGDEASPDDAPEEHPVDESPENAGSDEEAPEENSDAADAENSDVSTQNDYGNIENVDESKVEDVISENGAEDHSGDRTPRDDEENNDDSHQSDGGDKENVDESKVEDVISENDAVDRIGDIIPRDDKGNSDANAESDKAEPHSEADDVTDTKGYNLKKKDDEVNGSSCPTNCTGGTQMVCARCVHGIYRTFMSLCHVRQFVCSYPAEKMELISRYPCMLSAPYWSKTARDQVRWQIADQNDFDRVLRYVECRAEGRLKDGNRKNKTLDERIDVFQHKCDMFGDDVNRK